MGNSSENLNLYLTDMDTDGNDTFDFDRDLNENWDKIDKNFALYAYQADKTYKKGAWVVGTIDGKKSIYESLTDDNINNILTNKTMWKKISLGSSGLEVCDIGMSLFVDETKGLRRRLNGQIVDINTNTQGFLTRLKQITTLCPSLLCTEEEWQAIKTMSKLGQCGKFVYNYGSDGSTVISVRLPAVVNINGLVDMANAGLIKDESLPNIKQYLGRVECPNNNLPQATIESKAENYTFRDEPFIGDSLVHITFNANNTNSVYKDNAPVQQEAIQYPYFIQIATGQETEVNIKDTLELNNPFTFGMNMYFKGEMENISWLKSANQQNPKALCPDFYDWVLANANAGKDGFKLSTASDITDYDFEVNTTDETFRLPLKNGLEGVFANGVKGTGSPIGLTTDPSKSGMVVDTTVPVGYNLYYYVGVVIKNEGLINAGRINEQLSGLVEVGGSLGMPSNKYVNLTLGASGDSYTAPANGWLHLKVKKSVAGFSAFYSSSGLSAESRTTVSGANCIVYIPCKKGDVVTCYYDGTNVDIVFTFIYAVGDV